MELHPQQQVKPRSLVWSGYAVFVWSMAYMLPHLYWAFGGTIGESILKPGLVRLSFFKSINGVASVFLTAAGLIGLAFVYGNKGKVFRSLLLMN